MEGRLFPSPEPPRVGSRESKNPYGSRFPTLGEARSADHAACFNPPIAEFFYNDPRAPRPNRPIGVGALALIERDGKLLMEKRSDCGRWGFPGGGLEPEESLEEGLRREVLEETGLVVVDQELFAVFPGPSRIVRYPDGNVVRLLTFVYRAEVEDFGTLRCSDESEELRFFRRDDLPALDTIETSKPILSAYLDPPPELFLR